MTSSVTMETPVLHLERKSVRPYESRDEYVTAMTEDLAEWLNIIYKLELESHSFFESIEDGILLCRHANYVTSFLFSDAANSAPPEAPQEQVVYRNNVKRGTFAARDNVSNFISWCKNKLSIAPCLLFETNDLVLRSSERNVVLCLLEVARRGASYGIITPLIIQMEEEIDAEISAAKKTPSKNTEVTPQKVKTKYSNRPEVDLRSLDEMVRDLVKKCVCPQMFPMQRISEGRYRIGDSLTNIYVRILRYHVMVRIGGGWDTLENYLNRHDPCRCTEHDDSCKKNSRRISVFCNNKDSTDFSKITSRIDSGTPRSFKTPVKSDGLPTLSSTNKNPNRKLSASLDTKMRPNASPYSRHSTIGGTSDTFKTPRPSLILRRSSEGRHTLETPRTLPRMRTSPALPLRRRRHSALKGFAVLPDKPGQPSISDAVSEAASDGKLSANASIARQMEELRIRTRRGSEAPALGTPQADAELNRRMQKLFDEYRNKEIYGKTSAETGTPRTESSRKAAVERVVRARQEKAAKAEASRAPMVTPHRNSSRSRTASRSGSVHHSRASSVTGGGDGRAPSASRGTGSRANSRVASTTRESAPSTRTGGRSSCNGSRANSRASSATRVTIPVNHVGVSSNSRGKGETIPNGKRTGRSSVVGSRSNSRVGSVTRETISRGRSSRIGSATTSRTNSVAREPITSVSGEGDGGTKLGVERPTVLDLKGAGGVTPTTQRRRCDKHSHQLPTTRIPGPDYASSSSQPMKRYDSGVDINNISPADSSSSAADDWTDVRSVF